MVTERSLAFFKPGTEAGQVWCPAVNNLSTEGWKPCMSPVKRWALIRSGHCSYIIKYNGLNLD